MALLFFDSFDHYQTAQLTAKWTSFGAVSPSILAGVGRCGSQALVMDGIKSLVKGVPFASTTGIIGFAMNTQLQLFNDMTFATFQSADGSGTQVILSRGVDGSINAYRADAGVVLLGNSGPDVLRELQYYYVEWLATISDTVGVIQVWVNGVQVLNLSGLDTHANLTPSTTLTGFSLVSGQSHTIYFDDVYALNQAGSAPTNARLGDVHAEYLAPQAPGFHQDWGVVGVPTHWQAVSDGANPDDDATYIFTTTPGAIDTEIYASTGLPSGTIFGVQIGLYARKTDAGVRLVAPVIRHGGADFVGTNQAPSAATYHYLLQLYELNPGTGVAWTIADVNGDQYGIELTA